MENSAINNDHSFVGLIVEGKIKSREKIKKDLLPTTELKEKQQIFNETLDAMGYLLKTIFEEDFPHSSIGSFSHNILKINMPGGDYYKYFINIEFIET